MKLLHAFSPAMLVNTTEGKHLHVKKLPVKAVIELFGEYPLESHIGHPNLAAILSEMLAIKVVAAKRYVKIEAGERVVVAQYFGPHIDPEARVMPDGAEINFFTIKVFPPEGRGHNEEN